MSERYTDLRQKEVVNLCDGKRLGCICDVIVDVSCGKIEAIVVPGQCGISSIFKGGKDIIVPWNKICKFGEDVILVDSQRLRAAQG